MIIKRINQIYKSEFFFEESPSLPSWIWYKLTTLLSSYSGRFDSSDNDTYIGHTFPYRELRAVSVLLGVAMVAFTFMTLKLAGTSRRAATAGAIFVAVEHSYALQQQYITSQALTLFFLGASVYLWKSLELQTPLTFRWHSIAALLGLDLGLLVACTSRGWWTVYWVLVASAYQLWWSVTDTNQKGFLRRFIWSASARITYFLTIPLALETLTLWYQIDRLHMVGEGTPYMSGSFQKSFSNLPDTKVPQPIGYGSVVSIKHVYSKTYLHSNEQVYEGAAGSEQQVATGYQFPDPNNYWFIEKPNGETDVESVFEPLKHKNSIRLRHVNTLRRLHSHDLRPPLSDKDYQYEVSAYGAEGYKGNIHDMWTIQFVNTDNETLNALSPFMIYHPKQKCHLYATGKYLPYSLTPQQIVSCAQGCFEEKAIWYIEGNSHNLHTVPPTVDYEDIHITTKIDELKRAMALLRERNQESEGDYIKGLHLPFLPQGKRLFAKNYRQVQLIGNFWVWYLSIAAIGTYFAFKLYALIVQQRGWTDFTTWTGLKEMDHHVGGFTLFWLAHFVPCVLKEKPTLSDYLPALYGSILAFIRFFDYVSVVVLRFPKLVNAFHAMCMAGAVSIFVFYSPFIYGEKMVAPHCFFLDLGLWNLNCRVYHQTEEQYAQIDPTLGDLTYYFKEPPIEEWNALVTWTEIQKQVVPTLPPDSPLLHDDPRIEIFKNKFGLGTGQSEDEGEDLEESYVTSVKSEWARITDRIVRANLDR